MRQMPWTVCLALYDLNWIFLLLSMVLWGLAHGSSGLLGVVGRTKSSIRCWYSSLIGCWLLIFVTQSGSSKFENRILDFSCFFLHCHFLFPLYVYSLMDLAVPPTSFPIEEHLHLLWVLVFLGQSVHPCFQVVFSLLSSHCPPRFWFAHFNGQIQRFQGPLKCPSYYKFSGSQDIWDRPSMHLHGSGNVSF